MGKEAAPMGQTQLGTAAEGSKLPSSGGLISSPHEPWQQGGHSPSPGSCQHSPLLDPGRTATLLRVQREAKWGEQNSTRSWAMRSRTTLFREFIVSAQKNCVPGSRAGGIVSVLSLLGIRYGAAWSRKPHKQRLQPPASCRSSERAQGCVRADGSGGGWLCPGGSSCHPRQGGGTTGKPQARRRLQQGTNPHPARTEPLGLLTPHPAICPGRTPL